MGGALTQVEAAGTGALEHCLRAMAEAVAAGQTEEVEPAIARACEEVDRAGVLDPEDLFLWEGFARHLAAAWTLPEHLPLLRRLLVTYPWDADVHSRLLLCRHFLPETDTPVLRAQHRRWAARFAAVEPVTPRPCPGGGGRRRIGYLSPDFRFHCLASFLPPVLAAHDRQRYEIIAYSHVAPDLRDVWTERCEGLCDRAVDLWGLSDDAAAARIRDDGLDLLIDLAGHTAGHRLGVMARRPAAVQATYLGYPDTTGLSQMDLRFTDARAQGADRDGYSETLVPLDGGFACYRPLAEVAPAPEPPLIRRGAATFGCFADPAKYNPALIALWAEVLCACPGSRLLLRFGGAEDPVRQGRCRHAFLRRGVHPDRVIFDGGRPYAEHLAAYAAVDVALDTHPWSSHTTCCEALWMGVPVVSLRGETFVSRMAASVLDTVGLEALVAEDRAGYVQRAVALTLRPRVLADLRAGLRQRIEAGRLGDGRAQARALERAFEAARTG